VQLEFTGRIFLQFLRAMVSEAQGLNYKSIMECRGGDSTSCVKSSYLVGVQTHPRKNFLSALYFGCYRGRRWYYCGHEVYSAVSALCTGHASVRTRVNIHNLDPGAEAYWRSGGHSPFAFTNSAGYVHQIRPELGSRVGSLRAQEANYSRLRRSNLHGPTYALICSFGTQTWLK
jgi:hypothetical protein